MGDVVTGDIGNRGASDATAKSCGIAEDSGEELGGEYKKAAGERIGEFC